MRCSPTNRSIAPQLPSASPMSARRPLQTRISSLLTAASPQQAAYARFGTFRWRLRSQTHSGDRTSIAAVEGPYTDRLGYGRRLFSGEVGALACRSDPRREAPSRTAWGANILPRGAGRGLQSIATWALGRLRSDPGGPMRRKATTPPVRHCIWCWTIGKRSSFQL